MTRDKGEKNSGSHYSHILKVIAMNNLVKSSKDKEQKKHSAFSTFPLGATRKANKSSANFA